MSGTGSDTGSGTSRRPGSSLPVTPQTSFPLSTNLPVTEYTGRDAGFREVREVTAKENTPSFQIKRSSLTYDTWYIEGRKVARENDIESR